MCQKCPEGKYVLMFFPQSYKFLGVDKKFRERVSETGEVSKGGEQWKEMRETEVWEACRALWKFRLQLAGINQGLPIPGFTSFYYTVILLVLLLLLLLHAYFQ